MGTFKMSGDEVMYYLEPQKGLGIFPPFLSIAGTFFDFLSLVVQNYSYCYLKRY